MHMCRCVLVVLICSSLMIMLLSIFYVFIGHSYVSFGEVYVRKVLEKSFPEFYIMLCVLLLNYKCSFFFQFYWAVIDIQHYVSLRCTKWWFNIHIYGEVILTIRLIHTYIIFKLYFLMCSREICSLSSEQ